MNVFVPHPEPARCAEALWPDQRRFNKQIIECRQILKAIDGAKAWANHPATRMYAACREWLNSYLCCLVSFRNSRNTELNPSEQKACLAESDYWNQQANSIRSDFLTEEFCHQHKRRLYTKAPQLYPQFESFGTSQENWYSVGGKMLRYINGRQINKY